MIDALIAGKLHNQPTRRTGQSGKQFVTAMVRTPIPLVLAPHLRFFR